jgi:hypothetical protein
MAAQVTVTAAQIAVVFPEKAEIYDFIAAETITAGAVVYMTTAGKAGLADGDATSTTVATGVALNGGGAGQAISVLKRGHLAGVAVSGLAYGAPIYFSGTAGQMYDTTVGGGKVLGIVVALPNADGPSKCLYVDQVWNA